MTKPISNTLIAEKVANFIIERILINQRIISKQEREGNTRVIDFQKFMETIKELDKESKSQSDSSKFISAIYGYKEIHKNYIKLENEEIEELIELIIEAITEYRFNAAFCYDNENDFLRLVLANLYRKTKEPLKKEIIETWLKYFNLGKHTGFCKKISNRISVLPGGEFIIQDYRANTVFPKNQKHNNDHFFLADDLLVQYSKAPNNNLMPSIFHKDNESGNIKNIYRNGDWFTIITNSRPELNNDPLVNLNTFLKINDLSCLSSDIYLDGDLQAIIRAFNCLTRMSFLERESLETTISTAVNWWADNSSMPRLDDCYRQWAYGDKTPDFYEEEMEKFKKHLGNTIRIALLNKPEQIHLKVDNFPDANIIEALKSTCFSLDFPNDVEMIISKGKIILIDKNGSEINLSSNKSTDNKEDKHLKLQSQ